MLVNLCLVASPRCRQHSLLLLSWSHGAWWEGWNPSLIWKMKIIGGRLHCYRRRLRSHVLWGNLQGWITVFEVLQQFWRQVHYIQWAKNGSNDKQTREKRATNARRVSFTPSGQSSLHPLRTQFEHGISLSHFSFNLLHSTQNPISMDWHAEGLKGRKLAGATELLFGPLLWLLVGGLWIGGRRLWLRMWKAGFGIVRWGHYRRPGGVKKGKCSV